MVLAPAPLLAAAVLADRLWNAVRRDGASALATRTLAAWRNGTARPVWPGLIAVVVVAAAVTAWRAGSFGSGLRTGALAGMAALVAVLAVSLPEAVVWADERAGYLSTGDAVPPDWQAAVLDVLRPEFLVGMVVFWAIGTAGGAALGAILGRFRTRAGALRAP